MGCVSDGGRGEGHCVKVAIRGEDTPNDGHATVVGHPTGHAVKVSNIIPAAIKRIDQDQEEAYLRVRHKEDVCQRQTEPQGHGDLNSPYPNGLDGTATESFNC